MTELINTTLPSMDKCFPFQNANLFLSMVRVGIHVDLLLRFSPMGIPKKGKGSALVPQNRKVATTPKKDPSILIQ